ncbi:MAG: hypothetical protein CMH53_01445 [Myxococcales bacterium]|nr:hypothetical protein [Myxococcales bacterium]
MSERSVARTGRVISIDADELSVSAETVTRHKIGDSGACLGDWVRVKDSHVQVLSTGHRTPDVSDDWSRMHANHGERLWAMRERAIIIDTIRQSLRGRGLLEVETPAMAASPGVELHLDAVAVDVREGMGGAMRKRWLVTSPEFHMKRLLSAGSGPIFQIAKVFRSGERGVWHNPEFTMLEWYRTDATYHHLIEDFMVMMERCDETLRSFRAQHGRAEPPAKLKPLQVIGFAEALDKWADVQVAQPSLQALAEHCRSRGFDVRDRDDEATILTQVLVQGVEPNLPRNRPVVIDRWPKSLASLARRRDDDPELADRFEIYAAGTELANGFTELTDPIEQRQRFEYDLQQRAQLKRPQYPIDERFLAALEVGCPPCAGVAVGIDRVIMALGGYSDIDQVLSFPFERA